MRCWLFCHGAGFKCGNRSASSHSHFDLSLVSSNLTDGIKHRFSSATASLTPEGWCEHAEPVESSMGKPFDERPRWGKNYRLKSRVRENRPHGLEGGKSFPTPIQTKKARR